MMQEEISMIQIGKKIRFDNSGRITIPRELAEMLNITKGVDRLYWSVEGGKAVIRKVTEPIYGIDIEAEEIEKNLRDYEQRYGGNQEFGELSEEERRKLALEEYQRRKNSNKP